MRALKVIYVLAIAVALVFLVVVGVQAFYPEPSHPGRWLDFVLPEGYDSPEYEELRQQLNEAREEYQQALEAYEREAAVHARNVFLIALPLGLVFAVVGAFVQRRMSIFGAGLIVGGMGTMIFALTPYKLADIPKFIGIAVILAVLIFGGYRFFSALRRS